MPRLGRFKRIPEPGGETAQEAVSVYDEEYGRMPIPATAYVTSDTPLQSTRVQPSVLPSYEASIVQRRNRRKGLRWTGGRQSYEEVTPQITEPVFSSKFQDWLIGPQVNYVLNDAWYIAYPAATVMFGGQRNQALSIRVAQLPTRSTGGPTMASMHAAPRFKAVQTVPRYSTMPPMYPTASAPG